MTNQFARDRVADAYERGRDEALDVVLEAVRAAVDLADAQRRIRALMPGHDDGMTASSAHSARRVHCDDCGASIRADWTLP